MINCKFKDNIYLKDSSIIEKGTNVTVNFTDNPNIIELKIDGIEKEAKMRTRNARHCLTKFTKQPTIGTLNKWNWDGVAKSVTGKKCEPDGYGNDGSPSWMLILGVI